MIRAEHIVKSFEGRTVLKDITVEFETGKTNLIIGKSGSGKTVLLKSLVGLHEIDSGSVWYDGVNFTACLGSVRTSPDHGVAFDIAGQDKADPQSMRNAIYLATDIVNNRRAWAEWTSNPLPHAERERGGRDLSVKDLPDTEKES